MSETADVPDVSRRERSTGESVLTYAVLGFLVVAGFSGFASAVRMVGWGDVAVGAVNALAGVLVLALAAALGWFLFR